MLQQVSFCILSNSFSDAEIYKEKIEDLFHKLYNTVSSDYIDCLDWKISSNSLSSYIHSFYSSTIEYIPFMSVCLDDLDKDELLSLMSIIEQTRHITIWYAFYTKKESMHFYSDKKLFQMFVTFL